MATTSKPVRNFVKTVKKSIRESTDKQLKEGKITKEKAREDKKYDPTIKRMNSEEMKVKSAKYIKHAAKK